MGCVEVDDCKYQLLPNIEKILESPRMVTALVVARPLARCRLEPEQAPTHCSSFCDGIVEIHFLCNVDVCVSFWSVDVCVSFLGVSVS